MAHLINLTSHSGINQSCRLVLWPSQPSCGLTRFSYSKSPPPLVWAAKQGRDMISMFPADQIIRSHFKSGKAALTWCKPLRVNFINSDHSLEHMLGCWRGWFEFQLLTKNTGKQVGSRSEAKTVPQYHALWHGTPNDDNACPLTLLPSWFDLCFPLLMETS